MAYEQAETTSTSGEITRKASRGFVALLLRQLLYYGSIFLGNIVLARSLSPELYGVFAATLALQALLTALSDVGLGAALIQRDKPPTQGELAALFTLQVQLYAAVALGLWWSAPWVVAQVGQPGDAVPVVRALGLVFLVTALRSIPGVLLERELRFDVIALAEVLGMIIYQVTVVALVLSDFGLASIVYALAARYAVDLAIIMRSQPWRPRFSLRFQSILPYIRFGVGLQGVRMMSYIKDQLPLILLVPLIGAAGAGIWGWSLSYVGIPVYFNRLVDRLVFPVYARIQHDPAAMGQIAATAVWLNFSIGLGVLLLLLRYAEAFVPLVYGAGWLVALPVALLLAPNMVGGFVTGSLYPVLFATGQTSRAFHLIAVWVVLTGIGVAVGLVLAQLLGMALAYSLATLVACAMLLRATAHLAPFSLWHTLRGPAVALALALFVSELLARLSINWVLAAVATGLTFGAVLLALDHRRMRAFVHAAR